MRGFLKHIRLFALTLIGFSFLLNEAASARDSALLIDRELRSRSVELIEVNDQFLVYGGSGGSQVSIKIDECIAVLFNRMVQTSSQAGILRLSDGEVLPGNVGTDAAAGEGMLLWKHEKLGRIEVPLNMVASVQFNASSPPPPARDADIVELANGDRLGGFVTGFSDSLIIEMEPEDGAGQTRSLAVPFANIASVSMVTPHRPREGICIWFFDGTTISVDSLQAGDDGFLHLRGPWITEAAERWELSDVAAVVFDSAAIVPLASLEPARIEKPESRYIAPAPEISDEPSPADLASIEYRGPLVLTYSLPASASRFAAEAVLPRSAADFGDYELIIRSDDEVVFREQLDAAHPQAVINVALNGSELTIEMSEGANGPIQDRLLLNRAMLLID